MAPPPGEGYTDKFIRNQFGQLATRKLYDYLDG